jgi:hypothetical protein
MSFIILRHADTQPSQDIDIPKFMLNFNKQILTLKKIINKNKYKNIIIQSSPFKRCYDTALIICNTLNLLLNTNYFVEKNEDLTRWDKKTETRLESKNRSHEYGKNIKITNNDYLYIYITHSSIIPSFIAGLIDMDLNKFKKKNNQNLHNCGISFVKNKKLKLYNSIN